MLKDIRKVYVSNKISRLRIRVTPTRSSSTYKMLDATTYMNIIREIYNSDPQQEVVGDLITNDQWVLL